MLYISDLCDLLEAYLEPAQVAEVYRAYLLGAEAHEGQRRLSGEPYIFHPLAVAHILAERRLDHQTIIAAILHDVIEDTPIEKSRIAEEFGEEVAELVDGVSKLTHIEFESKVEAQAENFRKMMLAMTRDIRVILIKLADRLHNMRTLGVMRPDKRRRIARETLEIYAPIANRLGLQLWRLELQDLGFAAYHPWRSRVIQENIRKACGNRKDVLMHVQTAIQERLQQEALEGNVLGREKHVYSIYEKMRSKHLSFAEVTDMFGVRIVVDKVDTCYRVLGAVHNLYKPIPGKFKDYIAIPKANGYQSLHTALQSPYGFPIEVQIRTRDMDKVSEGGIAAHWHYKSGDDSSLAQHRAREWLRSLLDIQKSAGNSMEFLENVKVDLFPDEVYVFSPKGKIMELPRGATVVDFAYAVHTDVGNRCIAAKVDRRLTPLPTKLYNGQTVEIITASNAQPNPAWLNFVTTAKARSTIRNFLKNMQHGESVQLGRRMLNHALKTASLTVDTLPPAQLERVLTRYNLASLDDLLADIGLGKRMANLVVSALSSDENLLESTQSADDKGAGPLYIKGTEGTVVSFAKCCRPIPGDPILGYLSAGRGIVIHTQTCKNIADFRKHPEKWIELQWEKDTEGTFPVELKVDVTNQRGVLATVAAAIAETEANIDNISLDERDGIHTTINLTIAVRGRHHLATIMRHLRSLDNVNHIQRSKL